MSIEKVKEYMAAYGLENKILELYPDVKFRNNDESDSFAIILTHLYKEKGGKKIGK